MEAGPGHAAPLRPQRDIWVCSGCQRKPLKGFKQENDVISAVEAAVQREYTENGQRLKDAGRAVRGLLLPSRRDMMVEAMAVGRSREWAAWRQKQALEDIRDDSWVWGPST